MYKAIRADKDTWYSPLKEVNSKTMILRGIRPSRRISRIGKTEYYYLLEGTEGMYYSQSKNGIWFCPMAFSDSDMKRYYDLYCVSPLTRSEREYLKNHPKIKLLR